ncbi:MAG: glutamate--tRNA ligase [Theionarchaea archaeon]|nr:glutamate--tRNA ligase [Theionarchaea archaeon]
MEPLTIIRKYTLMNALEYQGTASVKAVMGKVMGESEELRKDPKKTVQLIQEEVSKINQLNKQQQEAELNKIYPEYFQEKEVKEKRELPPLPDVDYVVTRLPPEPNGLPHIGHGLSFYFNYYYARRYNGTVILRFDDTNPEKEELEYYEKMKEGIRWLEIDWDKEHYESDDLPLLYEYAEKMISKGDAYICFCPQSKIKNDRYLMKECECRTRDVAENVQLWKEMLSCKKYILRLKGDMTSPDSQMRDPTLFRVVTAPHPIQKEKYCVWPTYDFACAIEDSVLGITHVLRSNEFHTELQNYIREVLGMRQPVIIQYSRFNVRGSPASKRQLRPLIAQGLVEGWDDIRLTTLVALKRRGIVPGTIHALAREMGLSTSEPEIDWSIIEALNRKIIDPEAKRYFFVPNPLRITVENAPSVQVKLRLHPDIDYGYREITTGETFFVPGADVQDIEKEFRLKDLFNVRFTRKGEELQGEFAGKEVRKDLEKIQWVTDDNVRVRVLVPHELFIEGEFNPHSLEVIEGLAERAVGELPEGEIIQFERFGFCRIDKRGEEITVCFAHR